jgi:hypothetical protein
MTDDKKIPAPENTEVINESHDFADQLGTSDYGYGKASCDFADELGSDFGDDLGDED